MGKSASKQFAEEVLKAHNDYRKKHGVPPLKLCKKLNRGAQQYAEELATTRVLKHSSESANGKCGENLAWASYDQPGGEKEAVNALSFTSLLGLSQPKRGLSTGQLWIECLAEKIKLHPLLFCKTLHRDHSQYQNEKASSSKKVILLSGLSLHLCGAGSFFLFFSYSSLWIVNLYPAQ
ncbi:Golgi-associated plant pathogenesis-related protein 1 isoform X1 [Egretta garzetta]|uniref:Golgi-associated plant pathogenesis-related protein 1 isoform X1 n=1 Tax=Egretta garzetta TaxID=188379 RepID=UPI00163CF23D|nr:Golgi-associated plant pathogenesis-related protein 1 isoform X1 [Egretta garzetta]